MIFSKVFKGRDESNWLYDSRSDIFDVQFHVIREEVGEDDILLKRELEEKRIASREFEQFFLKQRSIIRDFERKQREKRELDEFERLERKFEEEERMEFEREVEKQNNTMKKLRNKILNQQHSLARLKKEMQVFLLKLAPSLEH